MAFSADVGFDILNEYLLLVALELQFVTCFKVAVSFCLNSCHKA
jgi:hypothetical protein